MSLYAVRQLPAPAGSATEPSVAFLGDSNTGLYSPGADQLAISTGGAGRVFVDAYGNVGIGTSAPGQLLDVAGVARFGANATKLITYSDSTYSGFFNGSSLTSNESIYMGAGGIYFYGAGTERLRIDSSGRLLVGTSSDTGGALLQVNDNRIRIATAKTPASATDTGSTGEICWDASYIYVCTATNTWKRTAIATW